MPQFVIVGLGIILLFRKSFEALFSTIFKSRESKAVGIAVASYFLYSRVFKKEQKEDALLNVGTDADANNAMVLFSALHPIFTDSVFGWYPPDGTDEKTALSIAEKYRGRFSVLAAKYKLIYDLDLAKELQSEGIYAEFMAIINGGAGGGLLIGRTVSVSGGWDVRDYHTGVAIGTTVQGDKYKVLDVVENSTLAGKMGDWVRVTYFKNLISPGVDAWINSGAFNA